jgi:glutamate dehydrogenase/leucine dehydrogenase
MEILNQMGADGHEQLMAVSDPGAGLKAIIAIHDTTLGPAAGGTRMWPYESEEEVRFGCPAP